MLLITALSTHSTYSVIGKEIQSSQNMKEFKDQKGPLSCKLSQVMHTKTGNASDGSSLEVASVVLYFDREPIINQLHDKSSDPKNGKSFFFPMAEPVGKCTAMMENLSKYSDKRYQVSAECVKKPISGIKITFNYDPALISLAYDVYDSISLKKAVIFRLYDQEVIRVLQQSEGKMLRIAHLSNSKKKVVVDCGHGGIDSGAIGCNGVQEKDLVLQIGTVLAQALRDYNIDVILTRSSDTELGLAERATIGNISMPDLFLSLHANASIHPSRVGIETFCLSDGLFKRRFTTCLNSDELLLSLYEKDLYKKSQTLASMVQRSVVHTVRNKYTDVIDGRVRHAAPQVLVGSISPSILIEMGYLSNALEADRLRLPEYQTLLARGIADGVLAYLDARA